MNNKDNRAFLQHIIECIGKIDRYLQGFDFEKFKRDEKQLMPLSEMLK